jgi:hypothetical protein
MLMEGSGAGFGAVQINYGSGCGSGPQHSYQPCCCVLVVPVFGFLPGVLSDARILDAASIVALYGACFSSSIIQVLGLRAALHFIA